MRSYSLERKAAILKKLLPPYVCGRVVASGKCFECNAVCLAQTVTRRRSCCNVTKLNLTILSFNCIPHPMNKKDELCGADVEGEMNWGEYGMKWSQYGQGEAGKTKLRIQVEGVKER